MRKRLLLLHFIACMFPAIINAQSRCCLDEKDNGAVIDFKIQDGFVWALTSGGRLYLFPSFGGETPRQPVILDTGIVSIALDRNGLLVVATRSKAIIQIDFTNKIWKLLGNTKNAVYDLLNFRRVRAM